MTTTIDPGPPKLTAARPGRRDRPPMAKSLPYLPSVVLLPLIVLPLVFLLFGSLRSAPPGQAGSWTLENFRLAFSGDFPRLLFNSFQIGAGSAVVAFVIGTVLALATTRYRVPGARILDPLIVMPAYVPAFLGAIAWTFLLSPDIGALNTLLRAIGLPAFNVYSMKGIILVSGLYGAPVAYLYIRPALLAFDAALEESARVFGATSWRALARVVLPVIKPALLSAFVILFITGFGEFAVPGILGTNAGISVISTQVLVLTTVSIPSQPGAAAVLGLFLGVVSAALVILSNRLTRGRTYVTVSGRMSSAPSRGRGPARWLLFGFSLLYVLVGLVLPLLVLVIGSLQPYLSPTLQSGWTLSNYRDVADYPGAAGAITNSILLSILSALACCVIAVALGWIIVRKGGWAGRAVDSIASMPIAMPHIVFGLSLVWIWVGLALPIYGTRWIILLAYIGMFLPFVVRASVAAFQQIDISLEEAARVNGAGGARTVRKIVVPLLVPAMAAAATIVMYHAMREVSASLLLYSPGNQVMPVAIWDLFGNGIFGELFALAVINVAVIFLIVGAGNLVTRKYIRST
ncbi:ABC transporter permease [Dactylosporangium sp. CS-033363]|uniref:ABC transporter permease n=1 Tax=Dactylosporangium sp. CS-033363 TaxID=3239935 RepID=UPI003D8A1E87